MKRCSVLLLVVSTIALAGAGSAAAAVPLGVFQGIVTGTSHSPLVCNAYHNEGEGYFRVKQTSAGKRVVPVGNSSYCGGIVIDSIVAPSNFSCNAYNANLKAKSIPIASGAFDYTGDAPIGMNGSNRHVRFKGHWDGANSRFAGFTRVWAGSCDSGRMYWHMKRVSPS